MSSSFRARYRQPLLGLAFLAIIVALVSASLVHYSGGFTSATRVLLDVPDAGSQLSLDAQVKVRGVVVGKVEKVESRNDGARLTLALDPDQTDLIPTNTTARILPKTLIGQDYVDLVLPTAPAPTSVSSGDVIAHDGRTGTVELETALDSLLRVLDAVPPQQVASTLNSLSTAFEGRGEELGDTLVTLQNYLSGLNPSLPELNEDIRQLRTFSQTYRDAAPDLLEAAKNVTTTTQTIKERQSDFDATYRGVRDTADDAREFLDANGDNLIGLADSARPNLDLAERYAPMFPCFFDQMAGLVPRIDQIFGAGTERPALNITVRVTNSRGKYRPDQDEPAYLDRRGPRCYKIVDRAPQHPDGIPIRDGSTVPGIDRVDPELVAPTAGSTAPTPATPQDVAELFGGEGGLTQMLAGLLGGGGGQ